ncbi:hypothetical protein KFE25_008178 [Diacronema lutheri]|uniref:cyclin-dependent kinase n=1 Tax=Diacronema lutheri TaxID=2081491 RepID=A0A8J5XNC5_DIALT|nr:hypothetical protein KFE25_008178 [Diacronema lutheri]
MAEEYAMLEKVGEGTFGQVFRAKHRRTGEVCALKKIRLKRVEDGIALATLRELKALQQLEHTNVVRLIDTFPHGSNVVLVLEYLHSDLARLLEHAPSRLCEAHIKCLLLMTLHGVGACHAHGILHRDLKPSNLLLSSRGVLKIGDFGQARLHLHGRDPAPLGEPYSHNVATRWYRAPELLFGARRYGTGVDQWAVGAIFAQLLRHAPLFPGENDIDQLFRVVGALGTPTEAVWPGVCELPDFEKIAFPDTAAVPLAELCPDASAAALDLLARLLVYAPDRRIGAADATCHHFFFTDPPPSLARELPVPLAKPPRGVADARADDALAPIDDPIVFPALVPPPEWTTPSGGARSGLLHRPPRAAAAHAAGSARGAAGGAPSPPSARTAEDALSRSWSHSGSSSSSSSSSRSGDDDDALERGEGDEGIR